MHDTLSPAPSVPLLSLAAELTPNERDALKFRIAVLASAELDDDFALAIDPTRRARFSQLLSYLPAIQPFGARIPPYGLVYRGRPGFITDALLDALRAEAAHFRPRARENYGQFLHTVDTDGGDSVCETLAASTELADLVRRHAGPCRHSQITSYIYYEQAGQCSKPHVDNAFTAVTAMVGLRHDYPAEVERASASVIYWPGLAPLDYRLAPGELALFFGISALHGRYPVAAAETVESLLMSFVPEVDSHG